MSDNNRKILTNNSTPEMLDRRIFRYQLGLGEMQEFLRWESTNWHRDRCKRERLASERDRTPGFCSRVLSEVRKLAVDGLPDRAREIEERARNRKLSAHIQARQMEVINDVAGYFPDVGAYLSGDPECMYNYVCSDLPSRIVNFYVNISANCNIDESTLLERGSALYEAIRALEIAGYSVAVTVYFFTRSNSSMLGECLVKRAGEYLDPSVLAYWLTDPSALRVALFRVLEFSERPTEFGSQAGYGRSENLPDKYLPSDAIGLGCIDANKSGDQFREEIRESLSRGGITIDL